MYFILVINNYLKPSYSHLYSSKHIKDSAYYQPNYSFHCLRVFYRQQTQINPRTLSVEVVPKRQLVKPKLLLQNVSFKSNRKNYEAYFWNHFFIYISFLFDRVAYYVGQYYNLVH